MKNAIKVQEKRRQEEILQTFFKEMNFGNMDGLGWLIVILMEFFAGAFICIPYQDAIAMETAMLPSLFAFLGVKLYIEEYVQFVEQKKVCCVYNKIKYLPVSRAVLVRWRMKKLMEFCGKTTLIFVGLQLLFAWVSLGTFGLDNILYPVIIGFVIPVGVCGDICCRK